jgi:hypothetical protein
MVRVRIYFEHLILDFVSRFINDERRDADSFCMDFVIRSPQDPITPRRLPVRRNSRLPACATLPQIAFDVAARGPLVTELYFISSTNFNRASTHASIPERGEGCITQTGDALF